MENTTPWLNPTVMVTVGLAAIGLIVWLVRLEGKTNLNSERVNKETEVAESTHTDILKEIKELKVEFYKHVSDNTVHHNQEAVAEFRKGLERRLDDMDRGIGDIARKLNHMAGRE